MNKIRKSISNFIFNRRVKKLKESQERVKKFMNYNDIHTILLLYKSKSKENNPKIETLIKELTQDGKKVTSCGFVKKKNATSPVLKDSRILSYSQIAYLGKPKNMAVADLLDQEYDMVLDLTLSKILPLRYILFYAKSPFKVGRRIEDKDLLDFMISLNSSVFSESEESSEIQIDEHYLYNQIIFYLKSIKSNN